MKVFRCDGCGSAVFFENVLCLTCQRALGFLPGAGEVSALESAGEGEWRALLPACANWVFRDCENKRQHQICNWLIPITEADPFCASCRLNDLIPNLSLAGNHQRWQKLEAAKRRALYTVMRLELPIGGNRFDGTPPLRFKLVGDLAYEPSQLTGHLHGVVTINIAEADDAERERRRVNLHEPYRTLLGHLRHELAHYFWGHLIDNDAWIWAFRVLFGNEREDYGFALRRHYARVSVPEWQEGFVSAYATAHPWEDWAETGAHYFHMMDMVETAGAFGMKLGDETNDGKFNRVFDVKTSFEQILEKWFSLVYAVNSLNRSMGLDDVYPFALSPLAIKKLGLFHNSIQAQRPGAPLPSAN